MWKKRSKRNKMRREFYEGFAEAEESPKKYYHVTHTKNVNKIKKKGLLPLQTSNWVVSGSGERYGGGEIFAFTHFNDAVRWAGNMDWTFNTAMGSGKISVIEILDTEDWDIDEADPLSQMANEGEWVKRSKMVKPESIGETQPVTTDLIKKLAQRT